MKKLSTLIAGTSAAIALSPLAGCAESGPSIDEERTAIATRFAACAIVGEVVKTPVKPKVLRQLGQKATGRETLTFSVKLTQTPEALAAAEKYREDDRVAWDTAIVKSNVIKRGDRQLEPGQIPVIGGNAIKDVDIEQNAIREVTLYPRNDYKEGDTLNVEVHTNAMTLFEDDDKTTSAVRQCGGLVMTSTANKGELAWQPVPVIAGLESLSVKTINGTSFNN